MFQTFIALFGIIFPWGGLTTRLRHAIPAMTASTTTTTVSNDATPPTTSTPTHSLEIYEKSGNLDKHLEGIKLQYDTEEKREFYAQVMGDGTNNIHFGKWDNVDLDRPGAYGKASEAMTDYMFDLAVTLLGKKNPGDDGEKKGSGGPITYIDLGSGTGAAALRLTSKHPPALIESATCLNLCPEQNAVARRNAADAKLDRRIQILTGTYEDASELIADDTYDLAFSQDAFVHAFSKARTYGEAYRITKPGGVLIFCDIMCGSGPTVSPEELQTFASTNMVNDWLSPQQNMEALQEVGWTDVTFVDLTSDIRISFQLMLKKVQRIMMNDVSDDEKKDQQHDIDPKLLETYKENLTKRIEQVDRGVFKWGVIHAKKPTLTTE